MAKQGTSLNTQWVTLQGNELCIDHLFRRFRDDGDMNVYSKIIKSVTEVRTVSLHMSALGKFMADTEDHQLYNCIQNAIFDLQFQMRHCIGRPIPTSLMFSPTPALVQLVNYCSFHKQPKRPEWQVLAERHGWSPPEKRGDKSASDVAQHGRSR